MEVKFGEQPLPILKCLVLNALIMKSDLTFKDYENFLIISKLNNPEKNGQISVDVLYELNVWLRQFGSQSFRDLPHLQRIADLIQHAYWAKQNKSSRLDLVQGHDLADWLAKCDENRNFYSYLTDPDFQEDDGNIGMLNKKIRDSIWKKVSHCIK